MDTAREFKRYIAHLSEGLGHADRRAGLSGYYRPLMLPLSRKSAELMAARVDPLHASARHQALHHFVAKSEWPDTAVMTRVRYWVMVSLSLASTRAGIPIAYQLYLPKDWLLTRCGARRVGFH